MRLKWLRPFALIGLMGCGFLALAGCRFAKKTDAEELDRSDDAAKSVGQIDVTQRNLKQIGAPRVSLLNAPCGNAAQVESFLAKVNKLELSNQFVKLPAVEWMLESPLGTKVDLCQFLQKEGLEAGFFVLISDSCADCVAQFVTLVETIRGSVGERTSDVKLAVVAIVSGVLSESAQLELSRALSTADDLSITAADPQETLWVKLSEQSEAVDEFPVFLVHQSGYGMFSNKVQTKRESIVRDFLTLFQAL